MFQCCFVRSSGQEVVPVSKPMQASISIMWSTPLMETVFFLHHLHFQGPDGDDDDDDENDDDDDDDDDDDKEEDDKDEDDCQE